MPSYEPIGALLRGLDVLRALNEAGPLTVGQLHAITGITKPTLVRVLETLACAGYVDGGDTSRRYAVTPRVLSLSNGYAPQEHLRAAAAPVIDALRQASGWPVELGVFDGDDMVILDTSRQPGQLSINRKAGSRVPLLRTALGRAWLAALPADELETLRLRLAADPGSDFALARQPAQLQALMATCRRRGYAHADQETLSNGRALGAAVMHGGRPVASINLVVHSSALSLKELEARFGTPLREAAQRISAAL